MVLLVVQVAPARAGVVATLVVWAGLAILLASLLVGVVVLLLRVVPVVRARLLQAAGVEEQQGLLEPEQPRLVLEVKALKVM